MKKGQPVSCPFYPILLLQSGQKICLRINIKVFLRGSRNGVNQFGMCAHNLPAAYIAALSKQLLIYSGREDGGDGKAPFKFAAPNAAGIAFPRRYQPLERSCAEKWLIAGEKQAAIALPAGSQPQPQAVALAQFRLGIEQNRKAGSLRQGDRFG